MFQFSFGQVSLTGDEATDGSPTLDVAVPVVINIIPPNALLSADTIITVSVSGGNATGRCTCMHIIIMCTISLETLHICLVLLLYAVSFHLVSEDFTLLRSEVPFVIGANDGNTITVLVDVLDDLLVEGTECFTLSGGIGSPAAPGSSFVGGPVTVCILDNDGKTCIRFSIFSSAVYFFPWSSYHPILGQYIQILITFYSPKTGQWEGLETIETKVYICKWAMHIYLSTCSGHAWC